MDRFNDLDMGLINPNPIMISNSDSDNTWFNLTIEDWTFVVILGIIVLIIIFSSRPTVGPAFDNMSNAMIDNSVSDFIMSKVSTSYVFNKKDQELKNSIATLKTPDQKNKKLAMMKNQIETDIQTIIKNEAEHPMVDSVMNAMEGGNKFRSLIAYSIINRMRRNIIEQGGTPKQLEIQNVLAPELMHSACAIITNALNNDDLETKSMTVITAMQLNLIGMKLVGKTDYASKLYAVDNQIRKRLEMEKINSSEKIEIDTFELTHSLNLDALNEFQRIINGKLQSVNDSNKKITKSKDTMIGYMASKSCSDFNLVFELSWIIGGGPVHQEYISYLRSMGTDFSILYQIADDFKNYYSSVLGNVPNFVVVVGTKTAYDEFFSRTETFVKNATELGLMTGVLKHVISYLSDVVVLSKKIIDSDQKIKKSNTSDEETDETDDIDGQM